MYDGLVVSTVNYWNYENMTNKISEGEIRDEGE